MLPCKLQWFEIAGRADGLRITPTELPVVLFVSLVHHVFPDFLLMAQCEEVSHHQYVNVITRTHDAPYTLLLLIEL
jgi:hypothetical protein